MLYKKTYFYYRYCAGALDRTSAVRVAYFRGIVSAKCAQQIHAECGMLAASIGDEMARTYINRLSSERSDDKVHVEIGCINSPNSVTFTGVKRDLEALEKLLAVDSIARRHLPVRVPYHSSFMTEVAKEYTSHLKCLSACNAQDETIELVSSVSGSKVCKDEMASSSYWVRNLTCPVRFADAVALIAKTRGDGAPKQLLKREKRPILINDVVEVGPHSALRGYFREASKSHNSTESPTYHTCLRKGSRARDQFVSTMGSLHDRGFEIDLKAVNGWSSKAIPLVPDAPAYNFNHSQHHWIHSRLDHGFRFRPFAPHDILGSSKPDWNPNLPQWRNMLSEKRLDWLSEHKVCCDNLRNLIGWLMHVYIDQRQNPVSGGWSPCNGH